MPSDLLVAGHLLTGTIAVLGMVMALVTRKGSHVHRISGRAYTYAMCIALATALGLAVRNSDIFIGLVAIFSAYFVYTGWRLAAIRERRYLLADQLALAILAIAAIVMFVFAFIMFQQREGLFPVLIVFGVFALALVASDRRYRQGWPAGVNGIALHLQRMGGASIATMTAVFVVNVRTEPEFIAWLIPSAVLIPTIVFFTRRLRL